MAEVHGWLEEVLHASPDGLVVFRLSLDAAGGVVSLIVEYANAAGDAWLRPDSAAQLRHGDDRTLPVHRSLDPHRDDVLWGLVATVAQTGRPHRLRIHRSLPVGDVVLEVSLVRMNDCLVIAASHDVSDVAADERLLAAAYEEITEGQATLQAALDATTDAFAIYELDHDTDHQLHGLRLLLMNASGARDLGVRSLPDVVGLDLRTFHPAAVSTGLWSAAQAAANTQTTQRFRSREVDETDAWIGSWDYTIAPVGAERIVITWRNVTDDEHRERELVQAGDAARYAANHDALTGLPNRTLLLERITEALTHADGDEGLAVIYLDLDGFKQVNDTYGHAAGDQLLCAVATRLSNLVRAQDTVARLGGDEFVIVLRLPRNRSAADFIARARAAIERPVQLIDGAIRPQASLGVVRCPSDGHDIAEIIRRADQAMYKDKAQRRQQSHPGPVEQL